MKNINGELRQIKADELEDFLNNPNKYFKGVKTITPISYSLIIEKLSRVVLPEGVEILDDEAFNWQEIKSYKMPKSLRIIGNSVFSGNNSLKTFRVPENVTYIGKASFSNCDKLEKVKLPSKLKIINSDMFWRCKKLKQIEIPSGVTQIRDGAFSDTGLTNIDLPESLEMIDDQAFKDSNLCKVVLPKSLLYVGKEAFAGNSLEQIEFNQGLEEIDDYAFKCNSKLNKIEIPDCLTKLGVEAFKYCTNLWSVKIGDGLEELMSSTFEGCSALTKVVLGKNIKRIREACFHNCESLENINLPEGLEKIDSRAFLNTNVSSIFLPKSIKYIGADIMSEEYYDLYIDKFTGNFSLDAYSDEKRFTKNQNMFKSRLLHLTREDVILVPLLMASNNSKKLYERLSELNDFEKTICATLYETYGFERAVSFMLSQEERKIIKPFVKQVGFKNTFNGKYIFEEGLPDFQDIFYGASKLLIALGAFESGYSQKATSFVAKFLNEIQLASVDKYINLQLKPTFNSTFAKHILNNSHKEDLIQQESINGGVLTYLYNNYDELQGYLRHRKQPTINLANIHKNVFSKRLFGLNKKTLPIAMVLSKYYLDEEEDLQNLFDRAIYILQLKEINNVPDHILSFDLNEKDLFSRTEEKLSTAEAEAKITTNILKTLAEAMNVMKKDNPYYFQFLNKGLVDNLVLGIDVDCCAHLENVGEGLAVQSVINPNTQNLVITDKKGNRIAKAIFTICPEDGYGVYNNVEIKNSIYKNGNGGSISADKISEIERYIYDKVMLATFSFVECYNKEHPNQPLKKFYMGVSDGDLNRLFISAYKKQTSNEDLIIHLNKVHYPNENGLVVYHDPLEKVVIYKSSGSNSCVERE